MKISYVVKSVICPVHDLASRLFWNLESLGVSANTINWSQLYETQHTISFIDLSPVFLYLILPNWSINFWYNSWALVENNAADDISSAAAVTVCNVSVRARRHLFSLQPGSLLNEDPVEGVGYYKHLEGEGCGCLISPHSTATWCRTWHKGDAQKCLWSKWRKCQCVGVSSKVVWIDWQGSSAPTPEILICPIERPDCEIHRSMEQKPKKLGWVMAEKKEWELVSDTHV